MLLNPWRRLEDLAGVPSIINSRNTRTALTIQRAALSTDGPTHLSDLEHIVHKVAQCKHRRALPRSLGSPPYIYVQARARSSGPLYTHNAATLT
jgi:hypothetical protein